MSSCKVLFEDDDLVVVDKPPGLATIPARNEPPEASLRRRLEAARGEPLWVVHRLDRETSGVVVFARNAAAHRALSLAFEARRVDKVYAAFVHGVPAATRIEVPLHAARKGKMRPARPGEAGAQAAITEVAVLRTWRRDGATVSRIEARPRTGRQHQIRVHLRAAGAPLVGDPLYTPRALATAAGALPIARLALHAASLEIGIDGAPPRRFVAPLPADLAALAAHLDQKWSGA
jgi:tRNA pseudouridine32 synthase/23S rRNA pseudouridine746 synthase